MKAIKDDFTNLLNLFKEENTRVFLLFSIVMLVFEYFGWQQPFHNLFRQHEFYRQLNLNNRHFYAQAYTTLNFILLFVILPMGFHLLFPVKEISQYGLGKVKDLATFKVYGAIACIMVPVVYLASSQPNFYNFYPLYRPESGSDWLKFELIYMLQFFCVEFFFRGFGLFRLEKYFGTKAVAIMTLPYALLHIHKPFPEAIGSIFAGLVLGYLSLKGRSIWPGVAIHMLIALSADAFGLYHSGWF